MSTHTSSSLAARCRQVAWAGLAVLAPWALLPGTAAAATTLTVRASGTQAGGLGPVMQVRVNGVVIATTEVLNTNPKSLTYSVPTLASNDRIDIVFTKAIDGQDRTLYIEWIGAAGSTLWSNGEGVVYDRGSGDRAFDGFDTSPGQRAMYGAAALRFRWSVAATLAKDPQAYAASRILQKATFGPTEAEIKAVKASGFPSWLNQQMQMPYAAIYVPLIQSRFDQGASYRPGGDNYTASWTNEAWWKTAATAPDQVRQRVAFALQQIFVVSQVDKTLTRHGRPYANYLDLLQKHAFGNYRSLLEAMALSPAMGIYLSHMRNQKENEYTGRVPDENFAREVMQLFTIGLHELNEDGSLKLDGNGDPIETYTNADVMAMAKVFTGWSWGFEEYEQTEKLFLSGQPDYATKGAARVDLRPMSNYPQFHSFAAKKLFEGKPHALTIATGTYGPKSLKKALDTLFNHPNVGPFIGRQLIQRLVTSNPTPAYVARVARIFNNNGQGVRGDLAAVVRTILLDPEAADTPVASDGKLREPVLRVTHWMRAFGARSATGRFAMASDLQDMAQRPLNSPSVFNYFRPGYAPPSSSLTTSSLVAPEFQITNESTVAAWVNLAQRLAGRGIGFNGVDNDVTASLSKEATLGEDDPAALVERLNLLLFAGTMPDALRFDLMDALYGVSATSTTRGLERAQLAVFLAMSSPQYLIQR